VAIDGAKSNLFFSALPICFIDFNKIEPIFGILLDILDYSVFFFCARR
jgi:hypothetical protein